MPYGHPEWFAESKMPHNLGPVKQQVVFLHKNAFAMQCYTNVGAREEILPGSAHPAFLATLVLVGP